MLGSFLYAAPEAMLDARKAGRQSDVYGLGMTAIFALYGEDLPADVLWEVQALIAKLEVSEECQGVLLRAVARKVDDRWGTVEEFSSELFQTLEAVDLSAHLASTQTSDFSNEVLDLWVATETEQPAVVHSGELYSTLKLISSTGTGSLSDAMSLAGSGSVTPAGTVTVTVLSTEPMAPGAMSQVRV